MDPEPECTANCEIFGRNAEFFESNIVPVWQGLYNQFVVKADLQPGEEVLDVGTGTGEVAVRAAKAVGPKGRVVGVDVIPQMLDIARRKAMAAGVRNLEFRKMALEDLELKDGSFDAVVGNYSLCCCSDYGKSVAECYRVLKSGGKLTYNHGGPMDAEEFVTLFEAFEKYKTKTPSAGLRRFRESDEAQTQEVDRYRDPKLTLALLKKVGFREPRVVESERVVTYNNPMEFINSHLDFDYRNEADEIPKSAIESFRSEAEGKLKALAHSPGFTIRAQMLYFSGVK